MFFAIDESYRTSIARITALIEDSFSPNRRRNRLSIMAEILDVARTGALKTQIMYRANMSFAQINEYLSLLLDLNLLKISKNSERRIYKTTAKGSQFIQSYRAISELLKKEEGNSPKKASSLHLVKRGTRVILL